MEFATMGGSGRNRLVEFSRLLKTLCEEFSDQDGFEMAHILEVRAEFERDCEAERDR